MELLRTSTIALQMKDQNTFLHLLSPSLPFIQWIPIGLLLASLGLLEMAAKISS
jgi:hypothetical protein